MVQSSHTRLLFVSFCSSVIVEDTPWNRNSRKDFGSTLSFMTYQEFEQIAFDYDLQTHHQVHSDSTGTHL